MSLYDVLFGPKAGLKFNPLEELSAADEIARSVKFKKAWDRYYGRFPKPLKVARGGPDDNVLVNFARIIADKGVSYLFGQDVEWELNEETTTAAEEWLTGCWKFNKKMILLQKLALNGAVCGHAFVKIIPGPKYPRLVVLDPSTVTIIWNPDDLEDVRRYKIQYSAIDPNTGRSRVIRQLIDRDENAWKITDQESVDGGSWTTLSSEVWPWAWPPIVDCQNLPAANEYWGVSDLEDDVLQLNAAINFVLSNIVRIIRFHAHPKTWGKGFSKEQFKAAVDEVIVLESPDGELHNLEMTSDLQSSIALYERLREALHEVTRVPEVATGKLDRAGSLSGVALSILYQPLIEKTETKRRLYGDLIVELNRRLLEMGGFGSENYVEIHWPELLPADPKVEAEVALIHQQLGVSQDTLLVKLGYDPDLERRNREKSDAELEAALGEKLMSRAEENAGSIGTDQAVQQTPA